MTDRRTLILDADLTRAMSGLQQFDSRILGAADNAQKLADNVEKAGDATKKIQPEASKLEKAIETIQGGVSGIAKTAIGLPGPFLALSAAAGAAAAAIKLVNDETARLDTIAKAAQKTGLGIENYQRLAHVATLSGSNIEVLSKAVRQLELQLDAVSRTGSGPAAEALEELGLRLSDLQGKESTEQLAIVADALGQVSSEADRSRLAMKLLGEDGVQLIPMFNAGGEAVRKMAADVGRVFTREELAKAEAYQDSLANLKKAAADIKGELAIGLAPVLTEINDKLKAGADGARGQFEPALRVAIDRIGAALKPLIGVVTFFAGQLAALGKAVQTVTGLLGSAADAVVDLGRKVRDWANDTAAAEWARETADEVRELADNAVGRLDSAIEKHLPWVNDMRARWGGVRDVLDETKAQSTGLAAVLEKAAQLREDTERRVHEESTRTASVEAEKIEHLKQQAIYAEHHVRLEEARGKSARELEIAYQNQYMAKLDLLRATNRIAEAEQLMRDEAVRQERVRTAQRRRGRGGARSSEAEILQAEGEKILTEWRQRLAIMEGEASLLFEDSIEFGEIRHRLAVEELRLEQQVLAAKKTKTEAERIANAARREAIDREIEILELTEQRRLQAESTERERTAAAERIAALDREIERNEALGVSVRLLQEQRNEAALDFAARFESEEALREEQHAQELQRIEESKERWRSWDELRKKQAEAESKRLDAQRQKQQQTTAAVSGLLGQGQATADLILNAAIKNDEMREKSALRLGGAMMLIKGGVEFGEGLASIAAYDYLGAALHFAASTANFVQGGMMMAGKLPGGGGQSGAAPPTAGGGFQSTGPSSQQAANEPPSTPASAEALTRMRGGYSGSSTSGSSSSSGSVVQINAGVIVTNDSGHQLAKIASDDRRKWGG